MVVIKVKRFECGTLQHVIACYLDFIYTDHLVPSTHMEAVKKPGLVIYVALVVLIAYVWFSNESHILKKKENEEEKKTTLFKSCCGLLYLLDET